MSWEKADRLSKLVNSVYTERGRRVQGILRPFETATSGHIYEDGQADKGASRLPVRVPVTVYSRKVVYCFREDQIPFLESTLSALEEEFARPEYMIRRSSELERLIAYRAENEDGVAKAIKASADRSVACGDPDAVLVGMRAHADVCPGPRITLAVAHQAILVFLLSEEDAIARVAGVPAPARKPSPEKVATKMVLLRLHKVQEQVKLLNDRVRSNIEDAARAKTLPKSMLQYVPGVPTEGDRESLIQYLDLVSSDEYVRLDGSLVKEVKRVLRRPDVTDAAVAEALRTAQVEEVMES